VWNVVDDPRVADLPESVRPVADVFNAIHELTFCTLDELFSGHGDQDVGIGQLYTLMSHGMRPTARYLVQQPVDGLRTAGPTFESVDLPGDPWSTTATLAADVAADRPALASVARRLDELASNR
jgi:hypothetical protein